MSTFLTVVYVLSAVTVFYRTLTVEFKRPVKERIWNLPADWEEIIFAHIVMLVFVLCPIINTIAAILAVIALRENDDDK